MLILCFILGIANFSLHKAAIESGHPFVEDTKKYFGTHFGPYGSYAIEFVILIAAMLSAGWGSNILPICYLVYTICNGIAVWVLLNNKL
jgi:Mn2+/Fe2+ NRAMP family transporter